MVASVIGNPTGNELKVEIPSQDFDPWLLGNKADSQERVDQIREEAWHADSIEIDVEIVFLDVFGRRFRYKIEGKFMPFEGYDYLHAASLECIEHEEGDP